jgi:predicted transposase YbfD/YdcC
VCASWIVELVSTGWSVGKPLHHIHLFITTLRSSPKALLRLVSKRWVNENQLHWPRDSHLGEDAHRYTHCNGVQVLILLRSIVVNLLRCIGFRSIRPGLIAAHHIS